MAFSTWIDEHLETFVRPHLGYVPNKDDDGNSYVGQFTPRGLAALHALWIKTKARAGNKTILLAGRDVFLFEVLARMEGSDTIFRPDISSHTYTYFYKCFPQLKDKIRECYCVDTGYRGSIPIGLGITEFSLISATSADQTKRDQIQIFPRARGQCVSLAGTLESVPKYWRTAQMAVGYKSIVQDIETNKTVFARAAVLTRHVAESAYIGKQLAKVVRGVL